jgi:hypothetical protein
MEDAMAIYDRSHDRHAGSPDAYPRHQHAGNVLVPLLLAATLVIALIAMLYQSNDLPRVGDTNNAGPSVTTMTPSPSPSTSPAVPTPTPTTGPRPTQAPIQ